MVLTLIHGICGINEITGKPYKNTDKLIECFVKDKSDLSTLIMATFPLRKWPDTVDSILKHLEIDLKLCIEIVTLKRPLIQVLNTSEYDHYLTEDIEFAGFSFMDHEFLVYRKLSSEDVIIKEFISNYGINDFRMEVESFAVSILGNGSHWIISNGEGCYEETESGSGDRELDQYTCYGVLLSLMETHHIVSDNEYGIEIGR